MEKNSNVKLKSESGCERTGRKSFISQLGVSMATAIDLYLDQISLTGGIPFSVSLRRVPSSVCMDDMTAEEMHIRNWKKATMR